MEETTIDKWLKLLRCPVALRTADGSRDAGRLILVRERNWLFCPDSGYKYPIIDNVPIMLIEEGSKWRDTLVEDLPVPYTPYEWQTTED